MTTPGERIDRHHRIWQDLVVSDAPMRVGLVLFEGFELLDAAGPLECYGQVSDSYDIVVIGPAVGPVTSAQGPAMVATAAYDSAPTVDIVVVPGGNGTRSLADDDAFTAWLVEWTAGAKWVTSVCTGSGLLASAGLLDGYRATSNKRAFDWVTSRSSQVTWVPKARWVHDRDRWTSAGVAAGIDMTLAIIAETHGGNVATRVAERIEYDWHRDAGWDPFAAINGLVDP